MRGLLWLCVGVGVGLLVTTLADWVSRLDEMQAYIENEERP